MPNALLNEQLVAIQPSINLRADTNATLMLAFVDLSIPPPSINTTGPRAPGLQSCRTTRLHWLQTGLRRMSNGSLVSTEAEIATYGGPMPGLNDIPHTYVFYLFNQPKNFTLPAWDAGRNYNPISVYARMNFSVDAIASVVGAPIAANYIRVLNPDNTHTGSASNGTCSSAPNSTSWAVPVSTSSGSLTQQRMSLGGVALLALCTAYFVLL